MESKEDSNKSKIPSLMTMLKDTNVGKKILKYYEEKQMFTEEVRVLMTNTIANYIEVKGYKCSLTDCRSIEEQICCQFPTEQLVSIWNNIFIQINMILFSVITESTKGADCIIKFTI